MLLLLSCLSLGSVAHGQQAASGRITQINVDKNGAFVRVQLDTTTINPGNCPAGDFYILEVVGAQTNRMISAMYMAMSQRLTVAMWVQGCTTGTYWGSTRPSIFDVYVNSP